MPPCSAFEATIAEPADAFLRHMLEGDHKRITDALTDVCAQLFPEDALTLSLLPWHEAAMCMSRIKGATRSLDGWFVAKTHTPTVDAALRKLGADLVGPDLPVTPTRSEVPGSFQEPERPPRLHLFLEMPDIDCRARRRLEF